MASVRGPARLKRQLAVSLVLSAVVGIGYGPASAQQPPSLATYAQQRDFLARHTRVLELSDGKDARVLICPEYQGRVMTSSCEGPEGRGFGWINQAFIEGRRKDRHFNNYGGEDRLWLAPEAGQFALFFAPGATQELANWYTPPGLNEGPFRVVSQEQDPFYRLARRVELTNASKTRFRLDLTRDVRLLSAFHFGELFGEAAETTIKEAPLKMVGFETRNTITNRGETMQADGGLVSIWTLGQFPPGDQTVIIVPYLSGPDDALGPVVGADYFGKLPEARLRVTDQAILFVGDGKFRSKIGTSQRRVRPMAGSIDFAGQTLTLVHFNLPDNPAGRRYVNNYWELPQSHPYVGDVFNSYNDGPPEPDGKHLGGFYELETLSPAEELERGKSLTHHHRTFHISGPIDALARIARQTLGVDLDEVRRFLNPPAGEP